MNKIINIFDRFVNYRISIKELYFSLSTWFIFLVTFLGITTKFHTALMITNVAIALYLYVIIILITNRILLSGFITLLFAVSFNYIKLIKWQFLLQDFYAADFLMLKLLINHGLFRLIYEYATHGIYLIFILLLVNFVLMWIKFDTFLDKKQLGIKNYFALRLISLAISLLLCFKLFDISLNKDSYFNKITSSIKTQAEHYSGRINGPFADILFTMQDIYIKPNYGNITDEFILNEIKQRNNNIEHNLNQMPDIIVILNESVFNPSKLDYDFAETFDFKFFQDNKYTKYSGILNVNTYGGGSWISEYEINTGIAHKSFHGPSYMPFITLIPHTQNSIMSHLRSLGYRVEVVYPVDKNFSLASDAYTKLGSDKITDIYEFGFKPNSWSKIPDTMISDMIIDALDRNPEKPKYIFASTMLNHGPHSSFSLDNIGCSRVMNDKLCSKLNDYMSRITKINQDQLDLIERIMKRKRKTIIVNFGDHLPSFEGYSTQLRFTRDIKDYYKTFYNINSNFDIKDKSKYPHLDITFIPGLILDMANLNNDDFYQSNSLMRKNCQGEINNCINNNLENERIENLLQSYKSLTAKQLSF